MVRGRGGGKEGKWEEGQLGGRGGGKKGKLEGVVEGRASWKGWWKEGQVGRGGGRKGGRRRRRLRKKEV